ncbi:T9SS type A sorting domain-containing protein [Flavobacteriaceae bacterium]|nr:T9SS type A sorting domain-containing protein [Flavobacteriaceae bacterium]
MIYRFHIFSLLLLSYCVSFPQDCDSTSLDNINNPGPYTFETIVENDGMRDGPDYLGSTLYYPIGIEGPFSSLILVPGFVSPESAVSAWGPYLASHGIIVMTIGTNTPTDLPEDRANALLDAAQTLQEENNREASPVYQQIDINKISVGGHSMGGGGAQIAATMDNSLKSVISLNPWIQQWLVDYEYLNHTVSHLIISGQNDNIANVNEHANIHYDYTPNTTPKAIYEIENGSHSTGRFPSTANNYVGKIVLSWLNYFASEDDCYLPLLLEYPEQASIYQNNLETFSINDDQNSLINFYPNPVIDFITLRNNYNHNEKYLIINSMGQIVLKGEIKSNLEIIDLSTLSYGIYMLKVKNNTLKIIKK